MSDLIERLRRATTATGMYGVCNEAADEIERLRAANLDLQLWFDAAREDAKRLEGELAEAREDADTYRQERDDVVGNYQRVAAELAEARGLLKRIHGIAAEPRPINMAVRLENIACLAQDGKPPLAYHETHEPPHCPTCGCAADQPTEVVK